MIHSEGNLQSYQEWSSGSINNKAEGYLKRKKQDQVNKANSAIIFLINQ